MVTTVTKAEGLGYRGAVAAMAAWFGEQALVSYVSAGVQVRAQGTVRTMGLRPGEGAESLNGPAIRLYVGASCFTVPLDEIQAWSSEVQSFPAGPEHAVLTLEGESWSLVVVEDDE